MTREEFDNLLVELSGAHNQWDTRFKLLAEFDRLTDSRKKICKALSDLYDACMQADGEGELYYTIDGDLLDAARKAMRDET